MKNITNWFVTALYVESHRVQRSVHVLYPQWEPKQHCVAIQLMTITTVTSAYDGRTKQKY